MDAWHDFISRRLGPQDLGFVVRSTSVAALVGFIDITNIVRGVFQSGYLSYFVVSGYEGQGFMSSGLKLLVERAFGELGVWAAEVFRRRWR